MLNVRFFILVAITMVLAAARLVPHPWNFTPVAAMALFGGACFASRKAAFLVPLAALVLSDVALGFMSYGFSTFVLAMLPFNYVCFALTVCLGLWLRNHLNFVSIGGATLAASVLHFLFSNAGFWLLDQRLNDAPDYTPDLAGLANCYVQALPFFRTALAGNLFYALLLFGGLALARSYYGARAAMTADYQAAGN